MNKLLIILVLMIIAFSFPLNRTEAKSYIKSYSRGNSNVRGHIRYKADRYKFNNYMYRPDRGYRR